MLSISFSSFSNNLTFTTKQNSSFFLSSSIHNKPFDHPLKFHKTSLFISTQLSRKPHNLTVKCSSNPGESSSSSSSEEAEVSSTTVEDEWLNKLPDKKKPLYSHSLPCIEAWIKSLGFTQSNEDRAVWFIEKPEWHAQLSLDITEIYIRYMKSGPGNLEKDMERRFSYALSREDIENAVLGGP